MRNGLAQIATNTKLWSQELDTFKEKLFYETLTKTGAIQTLFRYDNNSAWLQWTEDTNVAKVPAADDALEKIVFTGTDVPRITTNSLYNSASPGSSMPPASYILGIPKPPNDPTFVLGAAGNISGSINYVYTYVRTWPDGSTDEGQPSEASNTLTADAQQVVMSMPNTSAPDFDEYGITHKRLYRVTTSDSAAEFQFVAEIPASTTTYVDDTETPSEVLETADYLPPPNDLIGIIALPNGVLAGFKENTLYLSEAHKPHSFPLNNQYPVSFQIVALGSYGTTVIVGTTGKPSIFQGVDPAAYSGQQLPQNQACASKRSMASGEFGVMYASNDGLVVIGPSGLRVATWDHFDRDDWAAYYPSTIHAASFDAGRYMGFYRTYDQGGGIYDGAGFIFDMREGKNAFIDLDMYAYALYNSIQESALFMVLKTGDDTTQNQVYKWDADPDLQMTATWRSHIAVTPALENFGGAIVDASYEDGISAAEYAALLAQIAAITAANQALLAGGTNGTLGGHQINGVMINGDSTLTELPNSNVTVAVVYFKYYADSVLKYEKTVADREPFPMPGGFLDTRHTVQVTSQIGIRQIALASEIDELAQI